MHCFLLKVSKNCQKEILLLVQRLCYARILLIPHTYIVYKFMCSCCKATYYGQTQKHFFVRASEYLGITPLTGTFAKMPTKFAIFLIICYWMIIKQVLTIVRCF